MFQSDTGTKYYKEIPLSDILSIESAKAPFKPGSYSRYRTNMAIVLRSRL